MWVRYIAEAGVHEAWLNERGIYALFAHVWVSGYTKYAITVNGEVRSANRYEGIPIHAFEVEDAYMSAQRFICANPAINRWVPVKKPEMKSNP